MTTELADAIEALTEPSREIDAAVMVALNLPGLTENLDAVRAIRRELLPDSFYEIRPSRDGRYFAEVQVEIDGECEWHTGLSFNPASALLAAILRAVAGSRGEAP
jgi:hypothetical protein